MSEEEKKEEPIPKRIPPTEEKQVRIQTPAFMLRTNKDIITWLNAAATLVTEASFDVTKEGMLLRDMDPSREIRIVS